LTLSVVLVGGSPASSASSDAQTPSSTLTSIPGVSVDAAGTFHYTDTLSSKAGISNPVTSVLQGVRNSSGACVFSGSNFSGSQYEEEVAFNPSSCQETLVSGQLTSNGSAALAAMSPGISTANSLPTSQVGTPALSQFNGDSAKLIPNASSTTYNGSWSAFSKVAFIDPVNLTIVSLSNNFTWKISGSSVVSGSTTPSAYMEHIGGDVTTSTGSGTYYVNLGAGNAIESFTYNNWTNSDFEAWVVAVLGTAGYAACGFNSNPAMFYLAPNVTGYNNATYNTSWSDTVSGGCTNLVHFNSLSGPGSHS